MIEASGLCDKFRQALTEHWGYIWGASGQTWTAEKQAAATREMTVKYGAKWIGRKVADCSGLFVWAFKQLGGSIYHGSNTIWNKHCSRQGKLSGGKRADGDELLPGTAVFLLKDGNRHHIGLYVGGGVCIEAKGTQYGVVASKPSHWDEWGELRNVTYNESEVNGVIALRNGDRGEEVRQLQQRLNTLGYDCGKTDGIFGAKTEAAVRNFQQQSGLTADGIAGEKTLAMLNKNNCSKQQNISAEQAAAIREFVKVVREF